MNKVWFVALIVMVAVLSGSRVTALVGDETGSSEAGILAAAGSIQQLADYLAQGDQEVFNQIYTDFMRTAAIAPKVIGGVGGPKTRLMPAESISRVMRDPRLFENIRAMNSAKTEPRIWFGEETTAFLEVAAIRDDDEKAICSGTLIAPNAVLTAKHCHCGGVNKKVYFGKNFRDAAREDYVRVVKSIPFASCSMPNSAGGDLAVLLLERAVQNIKPRALSRGEWINDAISGRVVGFGLSEDSVTKPLGPKRVTDITLVSQKCDGTTTSPQGASVEDAAWYKCAKGVEIVAKAPFGNKKDTCSGDSGGPIMIQGPNESFYLAGVTSRGVEYPGAATCGDGGIYPRVDGAVLDWLRKNEIPVTVGS